VSIQELPATRVEFTNVSHERGGAEEYQISQASGTAKILTEVVISNWVAQETGTRIRILYLSRSSKLHGWPPILLTLNDAAVF
jgi:hypothetical protein